jgi:transcriptional regulator with XRE-family HTH domain
MTRKRSNSTDAYVGNRLRLRRADLRISQEKLADAIGLTFQQVQKYEKGVNRIGASRLHQIAGVLKVPVSYFFDGVPDQPKLDRKATAPDFTLDFVASKDGLALARAFIRISDSGLRRSIVTLVERIADNA